MVAGAALTAALALVALPGIAGSAGPSPASAVDPAAFQSVQVPAFATAEQTVESFDSAFAAAGRLTGPARFSEVGRAPRGQVGAIPKVSLPAVSPSSALKPPRYRMSGYATFYGKGTTAMRLPRGTTIVICGGGGCIERVVGDYGPVASDRNRIIDMYTPDFFGVCGCPSFSGTTWVTVSVY